MSVRVTSVDVKAVIETELTDLTAFISAANTLTDRVAAADPNLPLATLVEIERWLAAHFTSMKEPREESTTIADSAVKFAGEHGMGLQFTRFGQQALLFDTSGTLRKLDLRKAGISYLGREAVNGEMKET